MKGRPIRSDKKAKHSIADKTEIDFLQRKIDQHNDSLIGNYPMTYERLQELIDSLPTNLIIIQMGNYENMIGQRAYLTMLAYYQRHAKSEDLYTFYLQEVKPHLPKPK